MILVHLEIEDFKQFAGTQCFTPAPSGVIAVIGPNGAGKTTLFEAIEWCLYQPREIAADEVPPRGKVAKPRVQLTLMDPRSGTRYVIVRTLNKNKVADAEIYREDDANSRIVKGPRQVTEYVSKTLIGLSHRAFVSTFFTRQKELTFFGDMKETERRREVGRLLGMETIREAQKLIGDERSEYQNQAKVLGIQGREAAEGRDFAAELADAEVSVSDADFNVSVSEQSLAQAETTHAAARAELERLAALEREDATLQAALERIAGDIRAGRAQQDAARAELARMDEATVERAKLAVVAQQIPTLRTANEAFETAREKHLHVQQLRTDLSRAEQSLAGVVIDLEKTVQSVGRTELDGWYWLPVDASAPVTVARRLISAVSLVDLATAEAEANAFTKAEQFGNDLDQARAQILRFKDHLKTLETERKSLLDAGDPQAQRATALHERQDALSTAAQAETRLTALAREQAGLETMLAKLRAQEGKASCPTCDRPFAPGEIAQAIDLFAARLTELSNERTTVESQRMDAQIAAATLADAIGALDARIEQLAKLDTRVSDGDRLIKEKETYEEEVGIAYSVHLDSLGRTTPPTGDEIDSAKERFDLARRLNSILPLLTRLEATASQASDDASAAGSALSDLGDVTYDAAAHEAARNDLKAAERAAARVEQIDQLLAQRPAREAEAAASEAELVRLAAREQEQRAIRSNLGFDPAVLEQAHHAERLAVVAERAARDARAAAVAMHVEAVKQRDAISAEQARIAKLIEKADTRAREADQLEMMYREFNGFEQYVADRLTPQLADYTSELLGAITEGKYDSVWFNSNYGVEVFDGAHEHFDVAEFSGGERDVISLCARLSLSRLIGGQANNPPGFMVLDEVFGSLDRERRGQVLETLGALAGTADAFHQLFIISHVDDVRSSPIFNEIWRVAEGSDGSSQLENLNLTGGFEDL